VGTKIVFAVLAHRNNEAVTWLTANLAANCPQSDVVVFDSGQPGWYDGDAERLSASRPLEWGKVSAFHYLTMCELADRDYDLLVTLDYDVALIRPGFEDHLASLIDTYAYIAPGFGPLDEGAQGRVQRRIWWWWNRYWQPLLQSPRPYEIYNPMQAFRRDLAERIVHDPQIPKIIDQVTRGRPGVFEELVYASRVVSYGMPGIGLAGAHAVTSRLWTYDELEILAGDPNVFLVHKIAQRGQRDAIDRLLHTPVDPAAAAQRLACQPPLVARRRKEQLRGRWRDLVYDVKAARDAP
jgi:hypothetical protein